MLTRDLRHAVVSLQRTPGFTVAALVVLALGIGASTAIFSVVHGVVLRPLPFADPHELIRLWSNREDRDLRFFSVSPADYEAWRERARSLESVGACDRPRPATLRGGADLEPLQAVRVAGDLLPLLGVSPSLGRWLESSDPGDAGAAMISHELWQRRFGERPDVLGQPLLLDDRSWTIVGVMPPRFAIPNAPADVWLPLPPPADAGERGVRFLRVLARIGPGHDLEGARRELAAIATALGQQRPASNALWGVTVWPLADTVVGPEARRSVWLIAGAVGFVLLIACANVSSLLLARATARGREMAVRSALGASRGMLIRLLLVESLVLAVAAGGAGLLLASWGVDAVKWLGAASVPRIDEVVLEPRAVAFAALLSLLTALLFGLAPAFAGSRGPAGSLTARGSSPGRGTSRGRDALVAAEVALAVLLLVGAGLLARSFVELQRRALGFEPAGLLTAEIAVPSGPGAQADLTGVAERVISALEALPGVAAVAGGSGLPFSGPNAADVFEIEGRPVDDEALPDTDFRVVSGDYFRALGIPLTQGRAFTAGDGPLAPAVILSVSTAERYWPDGDPMGARVRVGGSPWMTVVGIVGDARYRSIEEPEAVSRSMMYLPHRQMWKLPLTFAIRASLAPESLTGAVRQALRRAAPELPVTRIDTMSAVLSRARGPHRFYAALLGVFAATALVLAAAGLYGLIAYLVARQTRAIAVRVALGASGAAVLRAAAGRGIGLAAAGLVLGLAGAWALRRVLAGVLFEVSPVDPTTYALVAGTLLLVTAVASYVPVRRALGIQPAEALRVD